MASLKLLLICITTVDNIQSYPCGDTQTSAGSSHQSQYLSTQEGERAALAGLPLAIRGVPSCSHQAPPGSCGTRKGAAEEQQEQLEAPWIHTPAEGSVSVHLQ